MTYIDIHVIQSVPPSNLNRDDTGSPKSAMYGGVRRARVSSQAWKKACRAEFPKLLDRTDLGVRTKRLVDAVVEQMMADDETTDRAAAESSAQKVLEDAGFKVKAPKARKKQGEQTVGAAESDYLVFLSRSQISQLAALARGEGDGSKKAAKDAADQQHGIEVSLFGRMVADDKDLSVDAACQVAHAISTHAVDDESDYFTAVDDRIDEDESGAGMLGTVEFNSATLYRYATINVDRLRENLGDDDATVRAIGAFARAFSLSMPTGKQNTFANRTVPDGVVIMVRDDQPVNLVGAYEDAVVELGSTGRVKESAKRLVQQAKDVESFVAPPTETFVVHAGSRTQQLQELGETATLDSAVASLENAVRQSLASPGDA